MAALRVLCSLSPHHRQGELDSMIFVPAPPHLHPDFMQSFAFYTTHWTNFHGSFHRTTGPVLCQVPLQLRDRFGAVFAALSPHRCRGIPKFYKGQLCYGAVQLVLQR